MKVELVDWKTQDFPEYLTILLDKSLDVLLTGSRYICNPPIETTDTDIVILVRDSESFYSDFERAWKDCSSSEYSEYWDTGTCIVRRDKYNLIVVDDLDKFNRWVLATKIATICNIQEKPNRAELFEFVKYKPFMSPTS